ncbi:MAG: hypothetical protein HY000_32660 [Planctomycetes bacterium]|nr:hypothetical protein [Planctomycetota bacterium]
MKYPPCTLLLRASLACLLAGALSVPALGQPAANSPIKLQWSDAGTSIEQSHVAVHGLSAEQLRSLSQANGTPDDWARCFVVSVISEAGSGAPSPLFGNYTIEDGTIVFRPRFPLSPGVRYRATFNAARLKIAGLASLPLLSADLEVPKRPQTATTVVEQVYPTQQRVPENQLKLYLHFSAPMSRGEAYDRVHLLDAAGKEIDLPFLELGEELWNPEGTRLTLLFDPGRIKRGLRPREEDGPILEEGKTYTFVVDRDWLDAQGNPLRESHRRTYEAVPPDDVQPDPKTWKIEPPAAGTRGALTVTSPEPLDHALFERLLTVVRGRDEVVRGHVEIRDQETRWQFTPESSWQPGEYRLVIETTLEDRAGNSIGRPFEVDLVETVTKTVVGETVSVPFVVK